MYNSTTKRKSQPYEEAIKQAIRGPFLQVAKNVKANFAKNQKGRKNNFFIQSIPDFEKMAPFMTMTRSLESSIGIAIQKCARNIAITTFGQSNVPTIINPNNLPFDLDDELIKEKLKRALGQNKSKKRIEELIQASERQVVISNIINADHTVDLFMSRNNPSHDSMKSLLTDKNPYPSIHFVPVDLGYFEPSTYNHMMPTLHIHEIKSGGNLDSKNANANARKLFTHYCHTNYSQTKVYFSTAYNPKGEGEKFDGSIASHLSEEMILSGSHFWQTILPEGIHFDTFVRYYEEVMDEIEFAKRITHIFDED
ncbi:TdeIII family type II restriction endonuclease [Alkalihalobacillus sp. BA299]|uniref:TdeIII family type II restriction endonuclease n=1 Tax=Alkalihalobacillus sp. BA299 TaxID=2815938 RepID=UPI001ADA0BE6|nr:TdeIII family type II restriction endonuclease [Alkalihalobacillus sp. BA299]